MTIHIIDYDTATGTWLKLLLIKELTFRNPKDHTEIYLYTSAEEFLSAKKEPGVPHVLITEIDLPDRSGLSLAEEIRSTDEQIPIIFYSTTNDYAMQCYDLDIAYYVMKPTDQDAVKILVDRIHRRVEESSRSSAYQ